MYFDVGVMSRKFLEKYFEESVKNSMICNTFQPPLFKDSHSAVFGRNFDSHENDIWWYTWKCTAHTIQGQTGSKMPREY